MMNLYITYSSDILLFPEIVQYITNFVTPLGLGYIEASLCTVISRKVVGKMCTRQSQKVIWDMINTLFITTVAAEPTFVAFL